MQSEIFYYKEGQWKNIEQNKIPKQEIQTLICFANRSLLESTEIYPQLKKEFKNSKILTCSTAGEINGKTIDENSAVVIALKFEKTKTEVAVGNIHQAKTSFNLGKITTEKLTQKNLKYVLVLSDGNLINGDELIDGIQSVLSPEVVVTGGMAGDGNNFQKTLVGLDSNIKEGNLVLLGLYGDNIKVGSGYKGGWDVFGPERIITKSEGNVLFEIDNESALELYKKYLGKYANELPSSALLFPISIKAENTENFIVRTILSIDEQSKSMRFAGNIPQGSVVRFMKSNFDRLIDAAGEASDISLAKLGKNIKPDVALIVSCVGRKIVLSNRAEEEIEAAFDHISNEVNAIGFFSYGEIARQYEQKNSRLHNQTISVTTLSEL